MCGRVIQKSAIGLAIVTGVELDQSAQKFQARYNGAPRQELLIIRRHPESGKHIMSTARWGLIHHSYQEIPKTQPINARAETVKRLFPFDEAYARRRCIVPIDGFFEWRAIKGQKAKQPYAIAMADGRPFGVAGVWENWRNPVTGHWMRTFCIITCAANALVAEIHDRMPVIIAEDSYERWLGPEPEADDLMTPYPAELMTMWPVSTRVNNHGNDDASLLDRAMDAVAREEGGAN